VATGVRVREIEEERQRKTVPGGAEGKGGGGGAYLNVLNNREQLSSLCGAHVPQHLCE